MMMMSCMTGCITNAYCLHIHVQYCYSGICLSVHTCRTSAMMASCVERRLPCVKTVSNQGLAVVRLSACASVVL